MSRFYATDSVAFLLRPCPRCSRCGCCFRRARRRWRRASVLWRWPGDSRSSSGSKRFALCVLSCGAVGGRIVPALPTRCAYIPLLCAALLLPFYCDRPLSLAPHRLLVFRNQKETLPRLSPRIESAFFVVAPRFLARSITILLTAFVASFLRLVRPLTHSPRVLATGSRRQRWGCLRLRCGSRRSAFSTRCMARTRRSPS